MDLTITENYLRDHEEGFTGKAIVYPVPIDFLQFIAYVVVASDPDTAVRRVDAHFLDENGSAGCEGITITNPDMGCCIICLAVDSSINTIVHEAVHAAGFVHELHSLHYSFENDESMAYMVGYLTDKVFDAIQKYGETYTNPPIKEVKKSKKTKKA